MSETNEKSGVTDKRENGVKDKRKKCCDRQMEKVV